MDIVRIMVRVPCESDDTYGRDSAAYEHAKLTMTAPSTFLSFFDAGIITARNMPKSATLRALTTLAGRILPMLMPIAVPVAHIGTAVRRAPKVNHGVGAPGLAMVTPKISSVMHDPTRTLVSRGVPAGMR